MNLSDDEILRRVQHGDRAAYVTLFDRHYARVERYARRWLGDAEAARDAASETFLRAYRHVGEFRIGGDMSYLGYLLLICRRLLLTEAARSHRVVVHSLEERGGEAWEVADTTPPPLGLLLEAERGFMLHEALDSLLPDDREIIHLAFERDLSRQDIAAILNKPSVTAVTSHLYRAMQKLRAAVAEQGYFRQGCNVE